MRKYFSSICGIYITYLQILNLIETLKLTLKKLHIDTFVAPVRIHNLKKTGFMPNNILCTCNL